MNMNLDKIEKAKFKYIFTDTNLSAVDSAVNEKLLDVKQDKIWQENNELLFSAKTSGLANWYLDSIPNEKRKTLEDWKNSRVLEDYLIKLDVSLKVNGRHHSFTSKEININEDETIFTFDLE